MITDLIKATTIPQLILYGKTLDISHGKLFLKSSINDEDGNTIKVNSIWILERYFEYIKSLSPTVTLRDDQLSRYKYRPKMLALDLYQDMEMWSLILKLNNMTSFLQFNKITIVLPPSNIYDIINEILILEADEITRNKQDNP